MCFVASLVFILSTPARCIRCSSCNAAHRRWNSVTGTCRLAWVGACWAWGWATVWAWARWAPGQAMGCRRCNCCTYGSLSSAASCTSCSAGCSCRRLLAQALDSGWAEALDSAWASRASGWVPPALPARSRRRRRHHRSASHRGAAERAWQRTRRCCCRESSRHPVRA